MSSRKRERLSVAVEQLRDKAALVDELFLDWVCDEFSDEQRAEFFQGIESADLRIYERVMDLRPDQLQAVVNAWAKQMTAELARWQVADEMSSAVQELKDNAEKHALTREDMAQGPYICGACDGEGVVYEPGSDGLVGDTWTCDACEGSGDVA